MFSVRELLSDCPMGHSDFQCDNLITRKAGGPTIWGQYKQALRELSVRYEGFAAFAFDYKRRTLKLARKKQRLLDHQDELERCVRQGLDRKVIEKQSHRIAMARLDAQECEFNLRMSTENFEKAQRELVRFYSQSCVLKEKLERHLGPMTQELRDRLEEEYWTSTAFEVAARRYLGGGDYRDVVACIQKEVQNFGLWPASTQARVMEVVKDEEGITKGFLNRPLEYATKEEVDAVARTVSGTGMLDDLMASVEKLDMTLITKKIAENAHVSSMME